MRKIVFSLSIGYSGCVRKEVVEYYHDATDEEIEQDYLDWRNNYLDGGWWDQDENS